MRSKQMLVRCGLLAVVVMSAGVSAAPNPGQLWPGLAGGIASLEATYIPQVATPQLDCWAVDWYGRIRLWLSCPTPDATLVYTLDGSTPMWYSPVCDDGVLVLRGTGTLKVRAYKGGMYASQTLVIYIH